MQAGVELRVLRGLSRESRGQEPAPGYIELLVELVAGGTSEVIQLPGRDLTHPTCHPGCSTAPRFRGTVATQGADKAPRVTR